MTIPESVSGAGVALPFSAFMKVRLPTRGGLGNGMRGRLGLTWGITLETIGGWQRHEPRSMR